jgi:hypothetical protein
LRACDDPAGSLEFKTSSSDTPLKRQQQQQVLHPVLLLRLPESNVPYIHHPHQDPAAASSSDHETLDDHQQLLQDVLNVFKTLALLNSSTVRDMGIQVRWHHLGT